MFLIAGAALAISGCGSDETAQNTTNVDADLASQNITANDTTSIDAASGIDANMAAETTIMPPEDGNEANASGNGADNESGNSSDENRD
jgi:hypothetical protein